MKLSIKNVKINKTLSEETMCFSADVYVDGKKAFLAANRGMGGGNEYYPTMGKTYAEVDKAHAYAASLPARVFADNICVEGSIITTYPTDLDCLVDDLLDRWQLEKQVKGLMKKLSFVDKGKIYSLAKALPSPQNIAAYKAAHPALQMLNTMSFGEACDLVDQIYKNGRDTCAY